MAKRALEAPNNSNPIIRLTIVSLIEGRKLSYFELSVLLVQRPQTQSLHKQISNLHANY